MFDFQNLSRERSIGTCFLSFEIVNSVNNPRSHTTLRFPRRSVPKYQAHLLRFHRDEKRRSRLRDLAADKIRAADFAKLPSPSATYGNAVPAFQDDEVKGSSADECGVPLINERRKRGLLVSAGVRIGAKKEDNGAPEWITTVSEIN